MLAFLAIFIIVSLIASMLVIAATMLSSRLSHTQEQYLTEEYDEEEDYLDLPAGHETSPPNA